MKEDLEFNKSSEILLGAASAALISAALGCLATTITHQAISRFSALSNLAIQIVNWLPKDLAKLSYFLIEEGAGLLVWLISWWALHQLWQHRNISVRQIIGGFLISMLLSVALAWKPIGDNISHMI